MLSQLSYGGGASERVAPSRSGRRTGADLVKWLIVRQVGASTQVINATVATADQGDVLEGTVQALVQP